MDLKLENMWFPCGSSPKGPTAEVAVKNQVDKVICTSDILYPHPPQSLLIGLMNKVKWSWWQGLRLCVGSTTGMSPHRGWPGYRHCWKPNPPTAETKVGQFPASHCQHQHRHWIPHRAWQMPTKSLLIKKFPLEKKKEGNGFSGLTVHCPSAAAGLVEQQNSLLKAEYGDSSQTIPGGGLYSESATNMWGHLPPASGVGENSYFSKEKSFRSTTESLVEIHTASRCCCHSL